ncbi:MAG: hypothetical protein H0T89_13875 [Deltaproteobacteria bacterium]|nr:hypothetical protein [Deltaproteobacteria bacterium]
MRVALLAALALAGGCSKKSESAKSDCAAAVEHGVDATIAKRRAAMDESRKAKGMPPEAPDGSAGAASQDAIPGKLKGVLGKLCVEDKWPADVVKCFRESPDIGKCKEGLTPEQRSRYSRETMQVMLGGRIGKGGAGAPMGASPHATGSDAPASGSAGSGSPPASGSN